MDTNPSPVSEPRSERIGIGIRASLAAKRLLQHAAAAEGLADRAHFLVDEEAFRRFVERLDASPAPSAALRRLMQTEVPWD